MVFSWLRQRRRRSLANRPFPADWLEILSTHVVEYRRLASHEQPKVRSAIQILVHEKNWEGCNRLEMTDEIKVTVAAQVAIMTLGLDEEYFDAVRSILVYPGAYKAVARTVAGGGVVLEGESHRLGEAWYRGPVILSWPEVLAAATEESVGENLVVHEFAHQLDMQNGDVADGLPPMSSREQFERWRTVADREYGRLRQRCHDDPSQLYGVLDCSAAASPAEFFAVASERFFAAPLALLGRHAELYEILREFYRQDPASRRRRADGKSAPTD